MADIRRKIATLLSADVARAGGRFTSDEPNALQALQSLREQFNRIVAEHGGRQFGSVGDGRMVEFPSAMRALQCAIAIQQAVHAANDPLPPERRVLLRIALHVGEVADESDGNLYGEGIRVAAYLQSLAVPGGIVISGTAHEHVGQSGRFEFIGNKRVNDVAVPVPTYQVLAPGVARGTQSLWAELKRRNVVRVGAAYAVVVWLLIQVAATILPTFEAPPWLLRGIIVALVSGFPLALLLAWLYEFTAFGIMRNDEVLQQPGFNRLAGRRLDGALIVLLIAAGTFVFVQSFDLIRPGPGPAARESIAVLAFDNLSADAANDYFADGLADEILNVLARVPELRVAPRTSSFSFKGRDLDAATIAETLLVDNVLEGTVRADGSQLRITANLIRGDAVLWTEVFDRNSSEILDIQAEIAYSVASAILPVLSPEAQVRVSRRPTDNANAYDFYLRGLNYLNRPAEENTLMIAADLFSRAIQLDPRFAAAWAARCETRLGQYEFSAGVEMYFDEAETDCRRAWTLDNGIWQVYVALGRLYRTSGQYDDAIVELRAALSRQPNAVDAYIELGNTYSRLNRLDDAEAMFAAAIDLDGGNWNVYRNYGHFLYDNERYSEAIAQYSRVIEFTPDSGIGFDNLGNAYWAIGDFESAAAAFRHSLEIAPSRWAYSSLGSMQYYLGDYVESIQNQLRSIELAPEDHIAWGRLAEAYRFIPGAEAEVVSAYRRAIELVNTDLIINPDDWDNIGLLAVYLAFSGHGDDALSALSRLREMAPTEPSAYYYEALVRWQLGDRDSAIAAIESAIEFGMSAVFIVEDPTLAELVEDPLVQVLLSVTGAD